MQCPKGKPEKPQSSNKFMNEKLLRAEYYSCTDDDFETTLEGFKFDGFLSVTLAPTHVSNLDFLSPQQLRRWRQCRFKLKSSKSVCHDGQFSKELKAISNTLNKEKHAMKKLLSELQPWLTAG